jgi:hypothetical protein
MWDTTGTFFSSVVRSTKEFLESITTTLSADSPLHRTHVLPTVHVNEDSIEDSTLRTTPGDRPFETI